MRKQSESKIPLHRDLSFVSNWLGATSDFSAGLRCVLCGLGCVAPVACGTIISVLFAIRTTRRSFAIFPLVGGGRLFHDYICSKTLVITHTSQHPRARKERPNELAVRRNSPQHRLSSASADRPEVRRASQFALEKLIDPDRMVIFLHFQTSAAI